MNILKTLSGVALTTALAGCAVPPPMGVTNASRADATVKFSYLLNGSQPANFTPTFNGAQEKAAAICKKWGYTGAEAVDELAKTECYETNMFIRGCLKGEVSELYMCSGKIQQ